MEIFVSKTCGLCAGSLRAIKGAIEASKNNDNVVLYKEILHNKNVINELKGYGISQKNNLHSLCSSDYVIIRGHGEPLSTFEFMKRNHIKYLDCTCPNVKAIHELVKQKNDEGYKIIIIGKHGYYGEKIHPEVEGIAGWCEKPILIEEEIEIENIDLKYDKYYLVVQTTFSKDKAESFISKISSLMMNKIFEYKNTICNAQKNINDSSLELAKQVDVMVVLGGKNSSNTKELYSSISKIKPTYLIENVNEALDLLNKRIISDKCKIGITAGASTLKSDINNLRDLFSLVNEQR